MARRSKAEIAAAKRRSEQAWAARIKRTYGITAEEYEAIKEHQGGVCAICNRANGKTRRLSVDHDHKTGAIRGILCRPCNNILGQLRDDAVAALRVVWYLQSPPAPKVIGERVVPQ